LQKEPALEKRIVICGGLANCPGMVERIKSDEYFEQFSITADEHFKWKAAAAFVRNLVNKEVPQ
jgi:hypothetical protein